MTERRLPPPQVRALLPEQGVLQSVVGAEVEGVSLPHQLYDRSVNATTTGAPG